MSDRRFYVYGFFNEKWGDFFYIGKGSGNRINHNDRSYHVRQILENYPCKRIVLQDNLTESEAITEEDKTKKLLISLGKPIIDYEAKNTNSHQREGIERAKAEGKYKGRKPTTADPKDIKRYYRLWKCKAMTKTTIAKMMKVSRPTLDKYFSEVV